MPVDTPHRQYTAFAQDWKMLRDVIAGERTVKAAGEQYLPRPSGRSDEEYASYIQRAVFYDTTGKTVAGMLGAAFRKAPTIDLPAVAEYLLDDADGRMTPLDQMAKRACEELLAVGRAGILVDFPDLPADRRLDEERQLGAAARLYLYAAEDIVNWSYERIGSLYVLTLVVLKETVLEPSPEDPFQLAEVTYYRVLRMVDGLYTVELYKAGEEKAQAVFEPKLGNGQRLTWIPFTFMGSTDNDGSVDKSPVYDIARVNLAHYRNSADYEDAIFMVGQPTPYITGLSTDFINEHAGKLVIGSRAAWLLPEGCSVGMLESSSDLGSLRAAMEQKEAQMVALGARIVGSVTAGVEAAETVRMRSSGESNTLSSIAENITRAFEVALGWAVEWMGGSPEQLTFRANDDFFSERLTASDLSELIKAWQGGAITYQTLFENLVKGEVIQSGTDLEQYRGDLEDEAPSLPAPDPADVPADDGAADPIDPQGADDPQAAGDGAQQQQAA